LNTRMTNDPSENDNEIEIIGGDPTPMGGP
jgi:hypothetical protein